MAEEKNEAVDFDAEAQDEKSGGRIFSATEKNAPKINLDEDIEKNIRIRTMPRKFKVSTATGDKKTTVVGAIIMVVGFLVLASAVYLAYIFLINPKPAATPAASIPQNTVPAPVVVKPVQVATPAPVVATSSLQTPVVATSTPATSTVPVIATSTTPIATSTAPILATSTISQATSTAPVIASSTSAINILTTGVLPPGSTITDSDKDGLSNSEEAIFGTDPSKVDSDGDGYSDGAEVLSLYNPAGAGKITTNPHIAVYQDPTAGFTVDYPKIWTMQNLNKGQSIIFSAADNSFIEIISMPDTGKMSIKDWYNSQFPDTPVTDANVVTKNGWQGIFHQTGETFYLADAAKKNIYTISYTPAADSHPDYYHIFLMMINSFTLK
jgi:hypothetical protein